MSNNIDSNIEELNKKKSSEVKHDESGPLVMIKSIVGLIITLFLIMNFIVSAYRIPTGSMERTLRVGDMLLVNKFIYGIRTPDWIGIPFTQIGFHVPYFKSPMFKQIKRGDVVVFKPPRDRDNYYVKRCVGVPGDTVEVVDKILFVNGEKFSDFYKTLDPDKELIGMSEYNNFIDGKPNERFVDRIGSRQIIRYPKGVNQPDIFQNLGSRDNFGPIVVPEKKFFMMGDNRDLSSDSRYWGFAEYDDIVGKPIMVYFSYDGDVPFSNLWNGIRWERIGSYIQ